MKSQEYQYIQDCFLRYDPGHLIDWGELGITIIAKIYWLPDNMIMYLKNKDWGFCDVCEEFKRSLSELKETAQVSMQNYLSSELKEDGKKSIDDLEKISSDQFTMSEQKIKDNIDTKGYKFCSDSFIDNMIGRLSDEKNIEKTMIKYKEYEKKGKKLEDIFNVEYICSEIKREAVNKKPESKGKEERKEWIRYAIHELVERGKSDISCFDILTGEEFSRVLQAWIRGQSSKHQTKEKFIENIEVVPSLSFEDTSLDKYLIVDRMRNSAYWAISKSSTNSEDEELLNLSPFFLTVSTSKKKVCVGIFSQQVDEEIILMPISSNETDCPPYLKVQKQEEDVLNDINSREKMKNLSNIIIEALSTEINDVGR
jgi:hypothetical protein